MTPKGTRPGEHRHERSPAGTPTEEPPLEQMLLDDAADVAAECADVDEAEVWASSAQVLFGPVGLAGPTVLPASGALAAAEASPNRRRCDGGRVDERLRPAPRPAPGHTVAEEAGRERRAASALDQCAR